MKFSQGAEVLRWSDTNFPPPPEGKEIGAMYKIYVAYVSSQDPLSVVLMSPMGASLFTSTTVDGRAREIPYLGF